MNIHFCGSYHAIWKQVPYEKILKRCFSRKKQSAKLSSEKSYIQNKGIDFFQIEIMNVSVLENRTSAIFS